MSKAEHICSVVCARAIILSPMVIIAPTGTSPIAAALAASLSASCIISSSKFIVQKQRCSVRRYSLPRGARQIPANIQRYRDIIVSDSRLPIRRYGILLLRGVPGIRQLNRNVPKLTAVRDTDLMRQDQTVYHGRNSNSSSNSRINAFSPYSRSRFSRPGIPTEGHNVRWHCADKTSPYHPCE